MRPPETDNVPPTSDHSRAAYRQLVLAKARALSTQAALVRSNLSAVRSNAAVNQLQSASLVAECAILRQAIARERRGLARSMSESRATTTFAAARDASADR